MNILPLYDRLVVKRIEQQETTRNGIFIPDSAKEKPQEGEVLAVGHGKRLKDGTLVALDVKVGDRILFGKYSGTEGKYGGWRKDADEQENTETAPAPGFARARAGQTHGTRPENTGTGRRSTGGEPQYSQPAQPSPRALQQPVNPESGRTFRGRTAES